MSYAERRRFLWILFLFGIAMVALFATVMRGTTLVRLSFHELVHQASAVARLRCISTQALWDHGEIWTETHFEVVEQQKGSPSAIITVRTVGGSVGNFHSHVDGVPTFRPGEEVYLFLWGHEGEPYRVLGWTQGTFRIVRDARTGQEQVTQDSAAMPIYQPESHEFRREGVRNLPTADFRLKLKKALEQ
jgi:hypothetical protein